MASISEPIHLVERLACLARARPDDPAIIDADRTMSYSDVHAAAIGTAVRLRAAGIGRGDLVGVLFEDSALFLVVTYALMRLGAIAQPVDRMLAVVERERLLRSFGTKAIISGPGAAGISRIPMVTADDGWLSGAADDASISNIVCDPTLPCELAASSGTTGMPKGFLIDHVQQRLRIQCFTYLGIGRDDRFLAVVGLQFSMALHCALAAIDLGGVVAVGQGIDSSASLAAACSRCGITWTYLVPSHLRALIAVGRGGMPLLPTLRRLIVAGSKLWSHERQAVRERVTPHLYEMYGANEVGSVALASPEDQIARPEAVGRLWPGYEVEAVGPEGTPLPPGTVGLIRFRGPGMAKEYFRNPEASTQQFRDGWFYPGDLGAIDGEGYVSVFGRTDDVINYNGIKFHPNEVEAALLDHPAVAEAAVIGWTTPNRQEVPIGFVVCRHQIDERPLIEFCGKRLAAYKVPVRIHFVPDLPKTGTGKVLRRRLRARLEQAAKR